MVLPKVAEVVLVLFSAESTTGAVWLTLLKAAHLTCRALTLPLAPL